MSKRLKTVLSAIVTAACIGCASHTALTLQIHRFIDVDEMIKLFPKMPKSEARAKLGEPLEVRAGLVLTSGEVYEVWLYAVDEKLQEIEGKKAKPAGQSIAASSWGAEKTFALTFKNDQLVKWGYVDDDWKDFSKEEGDILMPSPESAAKAENATKNEDKTGFSLLPSKSKK